MKHFNPSHDQPVLLPEVVSHDKTSDSLVLSLIIPENLSYFVGHFDRFPIVPGVVQIQWATHFAQQHFDLKPAFRHMEAIKFKELLLPGQALALHLRYGYSNGKLEFCYRTETIEYSSGRLYFHD